MVHFLKPVRWHTALALGVFLASIGAEVWSVYLLRAPINIVQEFTAADPGEAEGTWHALFFGGGPAERMRWAILWVVIAYLIRSVLVWGRHVAFSWQNMTTISHMRAGVYNRLQWVGFAFLDRYSTGQLINRAISDLKNVRQFLVVGLRAAVDVTFTCLGYLGMLWVCSKYLALAALLPLPFWIWALRSYARKSRPLIREQTRAGDEVLRVVTENIAGAHVVRAFAAEQAEQQKFDQANSRLFDRLLAFVGLQQRMLPLLRGIVALAQVTLFTMGAIMVQQGWLMLGDLVIFGVAIAAILTKLQQLNVITEAYQKAMVSCARLFEILDSTDTTPQLSGATRLRRGPGEIEVRQVTFGYRDEEPVLHEINQQIPAGKFITIVGPPGSGKSTLAALIGRCYDPWTGEVLIDGQDIRTATTRSVHEEVAFVFQDSYLFNDTVARNIAYGDVTAPMADIKEAAHVAGADEFIGHLPEGYDTLLGENGLGLSGGQRQRLSLARAILRDSRILVLDDALSAVDAATEADILYRLKRYLANQTLIMITSRIATCRESDLVLVVEHGRITQRGTHEELVVQEGYYRQAAGTLFGVAEEVPTPAVSHVRRMLVAEPAFHGEAENGEDAP